MESIDINEMAKNIRFTKQHPKYKQTVIDLLLYNDDELLLFFSTKEDVNYILNLMKYLEGLSDYFYAKDDLVKRNSLLELYIRCIEIVKNIVVDTETVNHQPPPKPFTGAKIIEIYDPVKVHKEFKAELNCDYQIFKAWFIDSVICDKQMSWKYDNENKTQLRSFIYVLCGGWKPAETNTAFKISVDSNVREGNLNSTLLQRIEKCTFK